MLRSRSLRLKRDLKLGKRDDMKLPGAIAHVQQPYPLRLPVDGIGTVDRLYFQEKGMRLERHQV